MLLRLVILSQSQFLTNLHEPFFNALLQLFITTIYYNSLLQEGNNNNKHGTHQAPASENSHQESAHLRGARIGS